MNAAPMSKRARRRLNRQLLADGALILPHEEARIGRLPTDHEDAAVDRRIEEHLRRSEEHDERIAETWSEMRREVDAIWDASRHFYQPADEETR